MPAGVATERGRGLSLVCLWLALPPRPTHSLPRTQFPQSVKEGLGPPQIQPCRDSPDKLCGNPVPLEATCPQGPETSPPQQPSQPPLPLPALGPHLEPPLLLACCLHTRQVLPLQPLKHLLLQGPRGLGTARLPLRLAPACGQAGWLAWFPRSRDSHTRDRLSHLIGWETDNLAPPSKLKAWTPGPSPDHPSLRPPFQTFRPWAWLPG